MTKRRPTGYNNTNYIDHRNCTVKEIQLATAVLLQLKNGGCGWPSCIFSIHI